MGPEAVRAHALARAKRRRDAGLCLTGLRLCVWNPSLKHQGTLPPLTPSGCKMLRRNPRVVSCGGNRRAARGCQGWWTATWGTFIKRSLTFLLRAFSLGLWNGGNSVNNEKLRPGDPEAWSRWAGAVWVLPSLLDRPPPSLRLPPAPTPPPPTLGALCIPSDQPERRPEVSGVQSEIQSNQCWRRRKEEPQTNAFLYRENSHKPRLRSEQTFPSLT